MKVSSSALLAAFALVGTTTNALVPTKLSYLTEQEWDAAAANYAPPVKEASSALSSFLESASSAILQLGQHRVLDGDDETEGTDDGDDDAELTMDDDAEGDDDGAMEGAFEAAAGGDVDDDEVASGDAVSFDPPIAYSQYTSDTCDSESLTYSGTISSIKLIAEGDDNGGSVFCATGEEEGEPVYTKLTNVECTILGVEDKFQTCSDEDCSECEDESFLGFTTWDQVFPDPVQDHCFQQIFSEDGETFDEETNVNIDFQFETASTDEGVKYTTFIVLNSCIQTFVSSDGVVFTDDSITVTDDEGGTTTLTDDSLTMEDAEGGTIVFTDDSVTLSGADDDVGLVLDNADVTETDDGGMLITATDDELGDLEIQITEDGDTITTTDDIVVIETADGDIMAITDDSISYGNADAYISFMEESAEFGSMETGDSFTVMGGLDFTDESVMFTPETGGSLEFKEETVIVEGVNLATGDATFTTITDPVYDYTTDDTGAGFFTIAGAIPECDDFFIGFNADSMYTGSEDCGFFAAAGEEGGLVVTDDSFTVGNEDVYIVFMEDSAIFGSTVTGSSFTATDLVIEATEDEEGVMVTNAGGGTITFTADTVTLGSVNEEDQDLTITDPVFSYMEDEGLFTIQGPTEDCDDFGLAFDAEGLVMGSIDCEFSMFAGDMTPEDIDDAMMGDTDDAMMGDTDDAMMGDTDDDVIMSASDDDGGLIIANDDQFLAGDGDDEFTGDSEGDDSSCETIEEVLCSGSLSAKFTVLCSLLQATPIPPLTLTIFAPTDVAFGNLLALLGVASAAEVDAETLTAILMFHVAPGQHLLDELECGQLLPMIGSGSSRTKCNAPKREAGQDFIMQKGGGNRKNDIEPIITMADIMACDNSVIHVISEVMLPDFIDQM